MPSVFCSAGWHPEGWGFTFFFWIFVAWSLLAALALHYLVEKPFLLLKERIGD